MGKIRKAQEGNRLKRTRSFFAENQPMKADYSVDTAGYAAGKKKFPTTITYSSVRKPSRKRTVETDMPKRNVKRLIGSKGPTGMLKKKRNGGSIKPKVSNVSKKLGSYKKTIGVTGSAKKKK
jgi:hypothetical protein